VWKTSIDHHSAIVEIVRVRCETRKMLLRWACSP
jgi:hypothetical protein